jgi:hypothetical protein
MPRCSYLSDEPLEVYMQLRPDEMIAFSVSPRFEPVWPQCACGDLAYRIVGVLDLGLRKEVPLCIRHFIEACVDYPLLAYVEGGSELGFHSRRQPAQQLGLPQASAYDQTPASPLSQTT